MNGISRHYEHQADQFGLEVAYGIVPDPNAAEAHALQILGEVDLADPDPNPFIKFWLYTHPPLDERIRFAATYKPWAEGKPMELLPQGMQLESPIQTTSRAGVQSKIANPKSKMDAPCGFSRLCANVVSLRLQRNFG